MREQRFEIFPESTYRGPLIICNSFDWKNELDSSCQRKTHCWWLVWIIITVWFTSPATSLDFLLDDVLFLFFEDSNKPRNIAMNQNGLWAMWIGVHRTYYRTVSGIFAWAGKSNRQCRPFWAYPKFLLHSSNHLKIELVLWNPLEAHFSLIEVPLYSS